MEPRSKSLKISPLGDSIVLIQWQSRIEETILKEVLALDKMLNNNRINGIIETVPAYQSLAIHYHPHQISFKNIEEQITILTGKQNDSAPSLGASKMLAIPVCYNSEFGPDLDDVMKHTDTSFDELIKMHCTPDYLVFMKGFLPGFTYLGGMHERLAVERKSNPRIAIPGGSVAIGGGQTGVYGIESPGGWNIIGRTPLSMFEVHKQPVSPVSAGDKVRFIPITKEQYDQTKREVELGSYHLNYIELST